MPSPGSSTIRSFEPVAARELLQRPGRGAEAAAFEAATTLWLVFMRSASSA
ncbi:hypothetical protein [Allosphingosinicella sp.]|uniref:hypothetical protein n=1 Tax=Allosphingosinicella sp. TaxID=2823234 RepID=UPI002FC25CA0